MSERAERAASATPVVIAGARCAPAPGPALAEPMTPLAAAWQALAGVYDPELCLDIVSLGLVYDVREEGDGFVIEMTLTTPGCPASESLVELARVGVVEALERHGAARPVRVDLVFDPPWNPSMISEAGAERLGLRGGATRR